jgi:hypothetical protein
VIEALRRLHRWAEGKLATRGARIAASVLALALVAALAWPALSAAQSLAAQRSGILEALGRCSAAERDPSAMQLLERRTVSANGRTYGGPRVVVRPLDLFDEEGAMPASVRDDLSWRLLGDQVPPWLPTALAREPALIVTVALAVLAALLAVTWLGLLLPAIEVGVPVIALGALLWSVGLVAPAQWLACCALGLLLHAFLWRGLRGLLSARRGPVAVASNTVLEGVRTLAAPGFALPAAALLPMLALARGPEDPLYQAIPGFLDWGHTAVFALAAVFVLFFGCATTAFEIRDRQVWSVVTKPVSPAGWMLGKWLGTLALGTAAIVAGTLMLGAGAAYLASQRPVDEQDAADVRNAVLVARAGTKPVYEGLPPDRLREIVDQAIENDAVLKADIANGAVDEATTRRGLAAAKQKEFLEQQRQVGPGDSREFRFPGLGDAVRRGLPVALRYKLHGGGDDEHERFTTMFQYTSGKGAGAWETREWTPGDPYSLRIDPKFVDDDGTFRMRIWNAAFDEATQQPVPNKLTVFVQPDSLEVMVTEATFGANLARAALVDIAKLAFLAALATVAGSVLSYPIAVLLSVGIFAMASLAPFLATSLDNYYVDEKSAWFVRAFHHGVLAIATGVEWALRGFASRSPSDALAQGRVIAVDALAQALAGIGFAWSVIALAIGWVAMRRKEVAVYSGQA